MYTGGQTGDRAFDTVSETAFRVTGTENKLSCGLSIVAERDTLCSNMCAGNAQMVTICLNPEDKG